MLDENIVGYMLQHAYEKAIAPERSEVKKDIEMNEAFVIFNEIVNIFKEHNVSYECACRLSISLTNAFLTGAVELYEQDNP